MNNNAGEQNLSNNQIGMKPTLRLEQDGKIIEFNLTINIYNTNDNHNNLANAGAQAGVSYTASDQGQISGDNSENLYINKEPEHKVEYFIEKTKENNQIKSKNPFRSYRYNRP
ncbi:hypothetical protein [Sutcliffiella rhizosphaerae]|uniref:Uncharacterized protein n=1 Tax=Sutcliffiella rhizosphaerae TaxID=2880967 RepID=A0ABM8YPD3_9BACI|nr:hypothetical protein [Sutcliffiella rhizosphaerae]CAG9621874.1 hypothetical protein BACCIP111883_02665 [Sutcliffiella rhizosphaerae]